MTDDADEPPTMPAAPTVICPKCRGKKGLPVEDGVRMCDLCKAEGNVDPETFRQWSVRNG